LGYFPGGDGNSILHDQQGNVYRSGGGPIVKTDASGNFLASYTVPGGAAWISLASNQHTVVYSSQNGDVKSFDTNTQTEGPDLIVGANAGIIRLLPDSSLVLDSYGVVTRWVAPCSGCYPYKKVFAYVLPSSADSLALDPDGATFWTTHAFYDEVNQLGYESVYRMDIKSGQVIATLANGGLPYGRYYSGSIGIYGDGMNSTATSTSALNFKSQLQGTPSAAKAVRVKNTSNIEMIVSSIGITGDFVISKNRCNNGIRPGTHCNIYVQFQPAQLGNRIGSLRVNDNATGSPQLTALSGNGVTASNTTLTSAPNPSIFGETVTLTAQVTSNAPGTPTGTVIFKNGASKVGSAALNAGVAVFSTSKLPVGTLSLTAIYNGDSSSAKSTSSVLIQVVNTALGPMPRVGY